jgi:membrane protein YdbS with pleckstrin-like domain
MTDEAEVPETETPPDEPRALAPRVRTWWRIGILLNALVPSAVLGAASWFAVMRGDWRYALGAALAPWLVAAVVAVRVPGRRYAAWRYRVTTDALRLDRGVMFRQESVVPYTRIQHVDTEQGPIERALGLSRVTVHTASGTSSSLTIPGLAPADAEALRERLAQLAGAVEPL